MFFAAQRLIIIDVSFWPGFSACILETSVSSKNLAAFFFPSLGQFASSLFSELYSMFDRCTVPSLSRWLREKQVHTESDYDFCARATSDDSEKLLKYVTKNSWWWLLTFVKISRLSECQHNDRVELSTMKIDDRSSLSLFSPSFFSFLSLILFTSPLVVVYHLHVSLSCCMLLLECNVSHAWSRIFFSFFAIHFVCACNAPGSVPV